MKILLTGASSFTGFHFARALAAAGHTVTAPLLGTNGSYVEGVRARRVNELGSVANIVWDCAFGSERFIALAESGPWDLLCHHAAMVGDYRGTDFDIPGALAANTLNLSNVLRALKPQGLRGTILTGSVFEQREGAGTMPLRAFSPYGLSKGLTAEVVAHRCAEAGVAYGKFVIPNPFGPYEEPRFCAYLQRTWAAGKTAEVRTPRYVRDNIHVDLLAACYVAMAGMAADGAIPARLAPSGYVESQGHFAERYARAFARRTGRDCSVALGVQTDFSEPMVRINTDLASLIVPSWDGETAWDSVVRFGC